MRLCDTEYIYKSRIVDPIPMIMGVNSQEKKSLRLASKSIYKQRIFGTFSVAYIE